MKKGLIIFLQVVIVLIGIGVLGFMLWEPNIEGRNVNSTLFEVYFKDPFLAYVYIASIAFFMVLYKAFKALGYVRQDKTLTLETMGALRTIKNCVRILSILIVMAALYVMTFHAKDDDPAGFIALCIVATSISIVTAAVAAKFERNVQNAIGLK